MVQVVVVSTHAKKFVKITSGPFSQGVKIKNIGNILKPSHSKSFKNYEISPKFTEIISFIAFMDYD